MDMSLDDVVAGSGSTGDERHVALAGHVGHGAGPEHAGHAMFDCAGNPVGHGRGAYA
jgi:hypothetical protein